jgi:hypothetical protein
MHTYDRISGDTEKLRKKMISGLNSAGLRVPGVCVGVGGWGSRCACVWGDGVLMDGGVHKRTCRRELSMCVLGVGGGGGGLVCLLRCLCICTCVYVCVHGCVYA